MVAQVGAKPQESHDLLYSSETWCALEQTALVTKTDAIKLTLHPGNGETQALGPNPKRMK